MYDKKINDSYYQLSKFISKRDIKERRCHYEDL